MKNKIKLIEKGEKLYVYAPPSEKIKVAQEFKELEGSIPNKTEISGTQFVSQIRKEANIEIIPKNRLVFLKNRLRSFLGIL